MIGDDWNIPEDYWCVSAGGNSCRITGRVASQIRDWMTTYEDTNAAECTNKSFSFEDIYGAQHTAYLGSVNLIWESSAVARERYYQHQQALDKEDRDSKREF
jgi:hypothetical protein